MAAAGSYDCASGATISRGGLGFDPTALGCGSCCNGARDVLAAAGTGREYRFLLRATGRVHPSISLSLRVRVQLIRHLKTCTADIYIHNECAHVGLSIHAPMYPIVATQLAATACMYLLCWCWLIACEVACARHSMPVVWVVHGTNCSWRGQPVIDFESPRTTMRSRTNRIWEIMHD
eukprot:COSAG05_NODE_3204_length_2245_cov_3.080615_2_plen_177_part_00